MRQQLCYFSLHEQNIRPLLQFRNTEIPMVFLKKYLIFARVQDIGNGKGSST
jgi:hypothetical protein